MERYREAKIRVGPERFCTSTRRFLLLSAVAVASAVGLSGAAVAQQANDRAGRALAAQLCAECHAVSPEEPAFPPKAGPRFDVVANMPGVSETMLFAWLQSVHPTMPNLILAPLERQAIVAYIVSLKVGMPQ